MSDTDQPPNLLAPVDFAAIELPDGQVTAGGFERLLELVSASTEMKRRLGWGTYAFTGGRAGHCRSW